MDLLQPGQIFAQRYRVDRFLANGGMGAVFVGEHTQTEQRVAIKVLWPHVLGSKDAVEKFQLEARVAGRVRSDNIVGVLDAGFDEETRMPFLVMELLEGKNLEAVVEAEGALTPEVTVGYMRQVCSALDRAHGYVDKDGVKKPIVHRDLKPENLFLARRDTGEPIVKVLDFGIAKVVSEGTKVSQEVKGTPLFMAYEQAAGGRITAQTDIWPIGLIGYYLLTGAHYWRAATAAEATITVLFGEVISMPMDPPTVRAKEQGLNPPFGPAFDEWFLRCMNRDPSLRFPTAGEAAQSLAQALGVHMESMVMMPAQPMIARTGGGAPAPGGRTGAGTQSPAIAPVDGFGASVPSLSRTNAVPQEPTKSTGKIVGALVGVGAVLAIGAAAAAFFVFGVGKTKPAPTTATQPPTAVATADSKPAATDAVPAPAASATAAAPVVVASAAPVASASAAPVAAVPGALPVPVAVAGKVPGPMPGKPGAPPPVAPPPGKPPAPAGKPTGNVYGDR